MSLYELEDRYEDALDAACDPRLRPGFRFRPPQDVVDERTA
jgi:hypothetical protein